MGCATATNGLRFYSVTMLFASWRLAQISREAQTSLERHCVGLCDMPWILNCAQTIRLKVFGGLLLARGRAFTLGTNPKLQNLRTHIPLARSLGSLWHSDSIPGKPSKM